MKKLINKTIYVLVIGLYLASPYKAFSQERQKAKTEEERQREIDESRRKYADEFRGKYIPTPNADRYVGKWRTKDGLVEIEIRKRIKEYKHLEFHFYHDVLDIEFTKFMVDGQEIVAFVNKKLEFSRAEGWYTRVDDPANGNKMRFVFYPLGQEDPNSFIMRYRQDLVARIVSHEKPFEIPDLEFIRVRQGTAILKIRKAKQSLSCLEAILAIQAG